MSADKEDHFRLDCAINTIRYGHKFGWCVDAVGPLHLYRAVMCTAQFGFAITKRDELCHVFSIGGNLDRVMRIAGWLNASKLFCYDTGLVQMYEKYGWVEALRNPFNPDLAVGVPAGLYPDYVHMVKP